MGRTETCSKVCIGLSIPAIIFLVIIGILLNTQPFYVSVEIDDPSAAATECYFAALLYLVALGLSFGSICYKKNSQRLLSASHEQLLHRDEGAELLGDNESGYGSVARLSQMPLMPQGYSRSDQYS